MASRSRWATAMRYAERLIAMAVLHKKSGRSCAERLFDDIGNWVVQTLSRKAGNDE